MLKRILSHLHPLDGEASEGAHRLEREGHFILRGLFRGDRLKRLKTAVEAVYDESAPDDRPGLRDADMAEMFRYDMFNRSAVCQEVIGHPAIREVLEPLLGFDAHVINCTAWRNPPGLCRLGPDANFWHVDAGPHVPRDEGVPWPDAIPYPIFVVATHIYLEGVGEEDGPTTVIPTSHRSGRMPPYPRRHDPDLVFEGHESRQHRVAAGDVSFFVSDVWHRRTPPTERSRGRFFLQTNFGRRDIAQRLRPTDEVNHVGPEAAARARSQRARHLIGLHPPAYYDG